MIKSDRERGGLSWVLPALLIMAASCWIYAPVLSGDWLWDDQELIANDVYNHDPSQWWRIWLQPGHLIDYQPLKATFVCLQWFLWGDRTPGYHVTNLVLHIVSALLVWRLLRHFGLRFAWMGGLLFAIHPAQVESVAWISEIKNTLSLPPFLLAMCFYLDYDRDRRRSDYLLAAGFFLVAMLCKETMIMFPLVILLHAWWRRGRVGWDDWKRSLPFFAISLAIGLLSMEFSRANTLGPADQLPVGFFSRLACVGLAISFYFSKCFWPIGFLPIYPRWPIDAPGLVQFLPWPVLVGFIGWLWSKRESWGRHALLGLGFFLINLIPVVAFILAKYREMNWSLDHMIYLPIIGLIGLAVAGGEKLGERLPRGAGLFFAFGLVLPAVVLLSCESRWYARLFVSQQSLFTYTLRYNPDAEGAHLNLGNALRRQGRFAEAIAHFRAALRLKPDFSQAHNSLGNALVSTGRFPEAVAQYLEAIRLAPGYAEPRNGLGNALLMSGKFPEAMESYREAVRLRSNYAEAHNGLANVLLQTGHLPEAQVESEKAIEIDPGYVDAHCSLGLILAGEGRLADAIAQFEIAARLDPADARIKSVLQNWSRAHPE